MPEMISAKLRILRRLAAHISTTVTTANGYPLELTGKVYRGRNQFGEEVSEPFLALLEAPRQIDPNGGGDEKTTLAESWTILIQGFAADDKQHPTDPAYILLACVQKAMARLTATDRRGGDPLYPAEYMLGGTVTGIRYQVPIVRPPDSEVSATAFFYMPITVDVVTDMTNPFVEED